MDPVDLLLPETDGGVLVQLLVLVGMIGLGLWLTRRNKDWRLVVIGVGLVGLGLIGFRALH